MEPVYFDIHTHKLLPALDAGGALIDLPLQNGKEIALRFHDRYFSAGIHPWDINNTHAEPLRFMLQLDFLLSLPQVVAVGECGLDGMIDVPTEEQILLFEWHIALAERYRKPLIIHCVKMYNELKDLRKRWNPSQPWIIHGFRGKPQLAQELMQAGFHLSIGTKYNPGLPSVIPAHRLLIETDDEACDKKELYDRIARDWQIKGEELDQLVRDQIKRLFGKSLW